MTRPHRRWLLPLVVAALGVVATGGPTAAKGGSNWEFDRETYHAGELATAVAAVSWDHNDGLGTPADGPYSAYVISTKRLAQLNQQWPSIPAEAVLVGRLVIGEGPVGLSGGLLVGPNNARVEFVVPDLPLGRYTLLHCNDPCTTTLGDIVWGELSVVEAPTEPVSASRPRVAGSVAEPAARPWPLAYAAAVVVGVAAVVLWRRARGQIGKNSRRN